MPAVRNLLPSLQLIQLFRELGGKTITVGSDGHSCRSAFSGIREGYRAIEEAGFTAAACFEQRKEILYRLF